MYRRRGASYDLKSIREYQSFDDPRSIDWRLFGRSDKAFVKEFYDEADDEAAFLLDTSASMSCAPLADCLDFVGSLAYILVSLGVGVRLWSFSGGLSERCIVANARSGGGRTIIPRALESLSCGGVSNTARSFAQWRARGRQKRVFVFSDFHERGLVLPSPPSGRLFLIRYRTPFGSLAEPGTELELEDPETGRRLTMPWTRAEEAAWIESEARRENTLASAARTFVWSLDATNPRLPVYWAILEKLYA